MTRLLRESYVGRDAPKLAETTRGCQDGRRSRNPGLAAQTFARSSQGTRSPSKFVVLASFDANAEGFRVLVWR